MRIKEFQGFLRKKKIDMVLIYNNSMNKKDPNFFYFTGIDLEYGFLVISKTKQKLFVPKLEYIRAKKCSKIRSIVKIKRKKLYDDIKRIKKKVKIIGINKEIVSLNDYKKLRKHFKAKFVDVSKDLIELRQIKDKEEIHYIRKSCRIADNILQKTIKNFRKFKTEKEVCNYLEDKTKREGCELAFKPIVASGRNAVMPHHDAESKLKKGFCVIDFGVKYEGYCSDITRTIYLGKPSKKEKKIYDLLLNIQKSAINNIKIGQNAGLLYEYVKRNLRNYGKYFNHGLGHGIGVEIHELPNFKPDSNDKIKKGMVFTIEPGIYFKNIGIRIEDDILISNKVEILTKTKKKLIIIK